MPSGLDVSLLSGRPVAESVHWWFAPFREIRSHGCSHKHGVQLTTIDRAEEALEDPAHTSWSSSMSMSAHTMMESGTGDAEMAPKSQTGLTAE